MTQSVPVGYTTPHFPSLYWFIGANDDKFQESMLYYTYDIWKFTTFWSMIFMAGIYSAAGLIAIFTHNIRPQKKLLHGTIKFNLLLWIFGIYLFVGTCQGFITGSLIGVLISEIYKSGGFAMSTWIPFSWAIIIVIFNVATSYTLTSVLL
ncbi:hypothetical protein B5S31_g4186 [[Candida] boidinii]|nr:hypothetical protein B5S31_g4186 [[Candida] boidinii]